MGVITVCDIDYGRIFGPFPTQLALMDPTYVIGMLTQDKRSEGPIIEVDPDVNNGLARASEWLAYIQPARDEEEQNVEAYMKNGQVFYRTLRIIKAKEELFVWYSKDFCQLIDMPEVKRSTIQESVNYICQACGEMFHHVFPLRAHMRFKCEARRRDNLSYMSSLSNENNRDVNDKPQTKSPGQDQNYDIKHSSENAFQSRKRHIIDEHEIKGGKISVFKTDEGHSPSSFVHSPKTPEKDVNANIHIQISDNGNSNPSAFRKVEKTNSPSNSNSQNTLHRTIDPTKNSSSGIDYQTSAEAAESRGLITATKEYISHSSLVSRVLPSHHQLVAASASSTPLDPQLTASMIEAYRYSFPQRYNSRQEAVMCGVNVGFNPSKAYAFADKINSAMPFLKTGNPMISTIAPNATPAMLQTPVGSLSVSQNWCAKCNASFRMTSDLVYHMRSHHKREFDPVKKKRDDKLKCNICHETFRERHHLTRHMTSHA